MGIENRALCRLVLRRGEQFFQFGVFLCPLGVVWLKGVGNAAPAHIAGQNSLFLRCGKAFFGFNLFQGADGFHVVLVLGFFTAHA